MSRRPSRARSPAPPWSALALATSIGALAACGEEVSPDAAPGPASRSLERSPFGRADELRALGYASWDEAASEADGVALLDTGRAQPWPRVWADDRSTVHVIDLEGASLRSIEVPRRTQVEFARVLAGGRIACVSVDEGLTLLEPNGSVVWHLDVAAHHEVTAVPDENALPGQRRLALATHVERAYRGRRVRFDRIEFVDEATGLAVEDGDGPWRRTWNSFEAREALMARTPAAHPLDKVAAGDAMGPAGAVFDYFHLNGIAFDGPDRMVICLRNVDLIAALRPGGAIDWSLGPSLLDWPHAPSMIGPPGARRLLVFDNGKHRGWSRALEVDPATGDARWDWRGTSSSPLFSELRGFAQRLPNGNTLITESERGRVIEVALDGTVVWEFWNPERARAASGASGDGDAMPARRRIYRMMAVDPDWIEPR